MKIRRAATLVCTFEGSKPVVHNFLKKEMFECNGRALEILALLDDWLEMEDALARLQEPETAVPVLRDLIQRDLVLIKDSPQAERDEHYRRSWRWGSVAGFYHFSLRDQEFLEDQQIRERMESYRVAADMPPLLATNAQLEERVPLPAYDLEDPFLAELHARQSRRDFSGKSISVEGLAQCLYAANGVKFVYKHGPFGVLPRTMTPSGGARNPYELYVYVRSVAGLREGFYHYSALNHDLGFMHDAESPQPSELLGRQAWTNECAAVVFMVATFERSAWKYRQPLAYRVVLMESGYIAQNLLLTANHLGMSAAPTGALAETRIEKLLGIDGVASSVIFAVVLGDRAK